MEPLSPNTYSRSQQAFINAILSGRNVFLTGKAGTGKSFITREALRLLPSGTTAAVGPTGIAATNIGGQTIHSLFSLQIHEIMSFENAKHLKHEKRRIFNKIKTLFY